MADVRNRHPRHGVSNQHDIAEIGSFYVSDDRRHIVLNSDFVLRNRSFPGSMAG